MYSRLAWTGLFISLNRALALAMIGGASLVIMAVLQAITINDVVMEPHVRDLLQQVRSSGVAFALLFSYPHFIWSFRFAYQQGTPFITRHVLKLVGFPILLFAILFLCAAAWNFPVTSMPTLVAIDNQIQSLGLHLNWTQYNGCGQLLLASLLILQIVLAGHHYCMQAFGVALSGAGSRGYFLESQQKQIIKWNLYALWAMNLCSGYTFFAKLNFNGFVYQPFQLPQPLVIISDCAFALSVLAVLAIVVLPNLRDHHMLPPLSATIPIVSVWLWLQPFWQPLGFQAWVVPLAHGAQYLFFAFKVENNGFDPLLSRFGGTKAKMACAVAVAVMMVVVGYLCFVSMPGMVDRARLFTGLQANFFLIAAFIFLSIHHYMVDTVVWKHDSRTRDLLPGTGAFHRA